MSENQDHNIIKLGFTHNRGETFEFGIMPQDRSKHMYVIGKTGMGKSTLLEYIAIQDIQKGNGITFMDPHGHSVEELLDYVPDSRVRDCIYFSPSDINHPIALNIMEDVGHGKRHLVASSMMSAFKKIWGEESWSDRMEHILNNTILALLEYPNSTLLDVTRMYANKAFRKDVVDNIKDIQVKYFWTDEFERYTDRTAAEATPAIQNKIGQLTTNPILRNIIGQPKTSIDFKDMINNKKIFLVNLAKGRIGETNSAMLGIFLSTKLYLTTLERAEFSRSELSKLAPMNLIIDEFQSFASDAFSNILSESRKYKLNLVLAHQHISQVEDKIRESILGNVGTMISFKIGPLDAEVMEMMFTHTSKNVLAQDLISQSLGEYFITLSIDGESSGVFSAKTKVPGAPTSESNKQRIINRVRNTYGSTREEAERIIRERSESIPQPPQKDKNKQGYQKPTANQYNRPHNKPHQQKQHLHQHQKPHFNKNNPNENNTKPHKEDGEPDISLKEALKNIRIPSTEKKAITTDQQQNQSATEQSEPKQVMKKEHIKDQDTQKEPKKPEKSGEISGFNMPNE